MSDIYTGGPAFPSDVLDGMSLRDYFAAHALAGHLSNVVTVEWASKDPAAMTQRLAQLSYEYADAMLAAREVKS